MMWWLISCVRIAANSRREYVLVIGILLELVGRAVYIQEQALIIFAVLPSQLAANVGMAIPEVYV
jgi:hypothetical protein